MTALLILRMPLLLHSSHDEPSMMTQFWNKDYFFITMRFNISWKWDINTFSRSCIGCTCIFINSEITTAKKRIISQYSGMQTDRFVCEFIMTTCVTNKSFINKLLINAPLILLYVIICSQHAHHPLVPNLWEGIPCPYWSYLPLTDTLPHYLSHLLLWSYSTTSGEKQHYCILIIENNNKLNVLNWEIVLLKNQWNLWGCFVSQKIWFEISFR